MSQKTRRSNREAKKPKQDLGKKKATVSASPSEGYYSNPVKTASPFKRK